MPLDRENITVASRIMLPAYVLFFAAIGLNYLSGSARLGLSPMLRYADELMPLQMWGALFLGCSLLMLYALIRRQRSTYRFGLLVCFFSMAVWTVVAIVGSLVESVSYSAAAWPGIVMAACAATNRSLARGERDAGA